METRDKRKSYAAEEVKAMADKRGLPCRLVGRKGIKHVMPLSTLEALSLDREWSKYYPHEYPQAKGSQ